MSAQDHITAGIGWREHPGDGPVLLALHGIGSQARAFDNVAALLPGWRVIAWEAPGYGPSAPLPMDWPVADDYATAITAFLDALDLQRVHVMGHSLGTLMGAAYAAAQPDRVASLTLASCAQGGGIGPGSALPAAQAARLDDLGDVGAEAFAKARAPRLVFEPDNNPDLVAAVAQGMAKVQMPGYGQAVRMLASGDLAASCAAITVPTAIVVGAEDVVTPPDQSRRAYAALPAAYGRGLTLVPRVGHALHQQTPADLASVIRNIQGVSP